MSASRVVACVLPGLGEASVPFTLKGKHLRMAELLIGYVLVPKLRAGHVQRQGPAR